MTRARRAALYALFFALSWALPGTAQAQSWLAGFKYRAPITISSGATFSNYDVGLTLNTSSLVSAGKMQTACQDVRFTDSDGATLLSYWIESGCNSASTELWVDIPSLSAGSKTIYLYYGNAAATSASNGSAIFTAFDNFEGTIPQWTKSTYRTTTGTVSGVTSPEDGTTAIKIDNPTGIDGSCAGTNADRTFSFTSMSVANAQVALYGQGIGTNGYSFSALYLEPFSGATSLGQKWFCLRQGGSYDYCTGNSGIWLTNNALNLINLSTYWPGATITQLHVSFRTWSCYSDAATVVSDDLRLFTGSQSLSYSIGAEQTLPTFTSVTDSPDPVKGGANVTVSSVASPSTASTVKLYVCKAADGTSSGCGAGGTWCASSGVSSNPSCSFASPVTTSPNSYYAYIFDNNAVGAANNPLPGTFTADSSPPAVSVASASPNPNNTGGQTVSWTASDVGSGLAAISILRSDNGGAFVTVATLSASATSWTQSPALSQGSYVYRVVATDNVGNTSSADSLAVVVDTTPPTVSASLSGTAGTGGWFVGPVTATIACADTGGANCGTVLYCTDTSDQCVPNTAYAGAMALSAQGTTHLRFNATDTAGNPSAVSSVPVPIDGTAPVAGTVFDGPTAGVDIDYQAAASALGASWTGFGDPESGIALYEWAIGKSPGATDVLSYTSVGTATSGTLSSLNPIPGLTYYVSVRATNGAGLTAIATSNGVQILGGACAGVADCRSGFCVDGVCCDSACGGGDPGDCQACSTAAGAPTSGTCAVLGTNHVCRTAASACDAPESCQGQTSCPADAPRPDGAVCGSSQVCITGACQTLPVPAVPSTAACTPPASAPPALLLP